MFALIALLLVLALIFYVMGFFVNRRLHEVALGFLLAATILLALLAHGTVIAP